MRLLAKDTAIHSGVYTFDIERDGRPEKVVARFSFTYKKVGSPPGWQRPGALRPDSVPT